MKLTKYQFGFTLIELLIVIGIIATLSVVVVLVINPVEYLKQSRDSRRLTELKSLNSALSLAEVNGFAMGSSSMIYVSVPDTSLTCNNLGLPSLLSGWEYRCSNATNYQKVDSTGWIPVNFSSITWGSPLSILPIDPVNATSSGLYYTYVAGGSWKFTALLESEKYARNMSGDGGPDQGIYELGTNLNLANFQRGLAGYWKFDEGNGTLNDSSGYGNNGAQSGGVTYGATGKVGNALSFDGVNDYIGIGANKFDTLTNATIELWFYYTGSFDTNRVFFSRYKDGNNRMPIFVSYPAAYGNKIVFENIAAGGAGITSDSAISANTWYHAAFTCGSAGMKMYVNGAQQSSTNPTTNCFSVIANTVSTDIGAHNGSAFFNGLIDDVRIYNRALSAAEISAIYNATK